MGKEQIIKTIQSPKVKNFLNEKGIVKLSLFGSYATGKSTKDSDIDFLFTEEKGVLLSLFQLMEVINFLKKILKKDVDLIEKDFLDVRIKKEILAHKIDIL